MKVIVFGLAALLLGGCAAPQQIVRVPFEVKVPIAVPCKVTLPDAPALMWPAVKPSDDVYVKGRALLADDVARAAYEGELRAAIAACQ